jgi:N-methylhydantoinase B
VTVRPHAELDPITLAVIRAALLNAVAEMKAVVIRTAYSNLWKEAGDLSCGILTGKGELLAPGRGDIPVHLVTMPASLGGCLKRFPIEELRPGDVLYQNDPYQGNNHLPDFLMAKPVFADGSIVAFAAVRGHYVDVGGSAPGSYTTATTDIYTEGLRIPPVRIFEEGVLNEDIVNVLQTNTRNSRERMGDLRSQYAGCLTAERRILAFCERYGAATLTEAMEEILDASERLARAAIVDIADGVYTFEDYCDGDGVDNEPFKVAVRVTVQGDEIDVDFTGSAPQVRGGMNAPPAVTSSATIYAIKCVTDPENISNSGSMRPIKVHAPVGTVVNPVAPAPVVAGNHETASRIVDAVLGALAEAVPDRVCAAGSGTSGIIAIGTRVAGTDGSQRDAILVETHGCGQGANRDGDGVNARRVNVGNTGNTPNEVLESSFPISMLSYSLSVDGGGAGRRRGGTGIQRVMRLEKDATVTITSERGTVPPYGLFGGHSAPPAEFRAELPDGAVIHFPSKTAPQRLPKGTVITFRCAGGGGYGQPEERELEFVQSDLDDGYVSVEKVPALYKVELRHDADRTEGEWVVAGRTA